MGLRTTHGAWLGSYSAFYGWRNALAGAAGYEVTTQPDPETGRITFSRLCESRYILEPSQFSQNRAQGDWSAEPQPEDPLLIILAHSDCDGKIAPQQATILANRLEQLIPEIPRYTGDHPDEMQLQYLTRKFVAGLRKAAGKRQNITFK